MKPEDHRQITELAIKEYGKFFTTEFSKMIHEYRDDIINGSEYEDELLHGMGLKRIFNWHFYSQNEKKYLKPFCLYNLIEVRPSSKSILDSHVKKFNNLLNGGRDKNKKKLMLLLGRILHHIQDMSTPAHVAPVYHGPAFYPKWKTFPHIDDFLEEYSKVNIGSYQGKITGIKEPVDNGEDILTLYEDAAKETLNYLGTYTPGSNTNNSPGNLFWEGYEDGTFDKDDPRIGFGKYTDEAMQILEYVQKGEDGSSKGKPRRFPEFITIYEYCLKKMIVDSLQCLKIAEKMW